MGSVKRSLKMQIFYDLFKMDSGQTADFAVWLVHTLSQKNDGDIKALTQ